ncbi:MAG: M20/M25/M40 family metallo-hydrolase [Desulfobacterota bacterium]|nr:M20/M25/M40 family metallo-hydrolase [Thermodesulfobacteriota bacterium]
MVPFPFHKEKVMEHLYRHVESLAVTIGERHLWKGDSLQEAANYIESALFADGYPVERQTYPCYGKTVSNLIAEKRGKEEATVVIGAHYDTVPGTPGADDNASAVAGLLELARLLRDLPSRKTLLFVAFANEEPPCFGFSNMGSMVLAKTLKEACRPVEVMVSLEMIGYFRPDPIQNYPLPIMRHFYPERADFIGVVGNFRSAKYVSLFRKGIKRHASLDVRSLTGPEFFGGINLSDNSSFWHHGFKAIMVTDTSFFRNPHYHQETDRIETLDFDKMAEVVKGLQGTLLEM